MDAYKQYKGTVIDDRYKLGEPVGIGGEAVVFSATDKKTGKRVALKMLHNATTEPDTLKHFLREAEVISLFDHENVIKAYDVSVDGPIQYIVMEYVDGMTLRDFLDYKGKADWRDAAIFTVQVLRALDHIHGKGIVHRDIKPSNIMILEGGYVKVVNFGISKILGNKTDIVNNTAIGTVYYISPEQAKGESVDGRSDIYSVGCMLYEMVTGKLPFTGETPVAVAMKQVKEAPVPPSQLNPEIPLMLEQIILRAMAKDPGDRFDGASQMIECLKMMSDPEAVFDA